MKGTLLVMVIALGLVACSEDVGGYDSSATWTALNESQKTDHFKVAMQDRLQALGFTCTAGELRTTSCRIEKAVGECTHAESIGFNELGVSAYSLSKQCAP